MKLFQALSPFVPSLPKAVDLVESVAGSTYLDVLETSSNSKLVSFSLLPPLVILSAHTPFPFATFTMAAIGLSLAAYSQYDYKKAKKALIEQKISHILAESKELPKRILIIQSDHDPTGALSMRSHVGKVRSVAQSHAIERVMIKTEKDFLERLPSGRFDIVWIRAHGHPSWIQMGSEFKLMSTSAPKYFHLLASKIKLNGKLILECCNTAKDSKEMRPIAEHIASYCWDATVYAPLTKISGICGLEFDKWGYPQFFNGLAIKKKNVTAVIEGPEYYGTSSLY